MKEIIDIYKDAIISILCAFGSLTVLAGCCVYYKQIIEILLTGIFYK